MVTLKHNLYLSEKVSEVPSENRTPSLRPCPNISDNSLSETQQYFLCFVHVLTCNYEAWGSPCFVLDPGTVLCSPSLFFSELFFFFYLLTPHMCLLPLLHLVTNNVYSWWKAQLCGNPWQRNVSSCQAWVMPGSVAWLLSVVSVGPGLKVFIRASHTPICAGLHLWSFAGLWP